MKSNWHNETPEESQQEAPVSQSEQVETPEVPATIELPEETPASRHTGSTVSRSWSNRPLWHNRFPGRSGMPSSSI